MDPALIQGTTSTFGPALVLPYTVEIPRQPGREIVLLLLEGWIHSREDGELKPGLRIPAQVRRINHNALWVPITYDQIEGVENARAGRSVPLKITLAAVANFGTQLRVQPNAVSVLEARAAWQQSNSAAVNVEIPREQWLKILDGLAAGSRRLIELPAPRIPRPDGAWNECVRLLDLAVEHHRVGHFEDAFKTCREVVEGIATELADHWTIQRAPKASPPAWTKELGKRVSQAWPHDQNAGPLLAALIDAAWTWTAPSHHYGSGIRAREEATFAIALGTDLLGLAADLMRAHREPVETP